MMVAAFYFILLLGIVIGTRNSLGPLRTKSNPRHVRYLKKDLFLGPKPLVHVTTHLVRTLFKDEKVYYILTFSIRPLKLPQKTYGEIDSSFKVDMIQA